MLTETQTEVMKFHTYYCERNSSHQNHTPPMNLDTVCRCSETEGVSLMVLDLFPGRGNF